SSGLPREGPGPLRGSHRRSARAGRHRPRRLLRRRGHAGQRVGGTRAAALGARDTPFVKEGLMRPFQEFRLWARRGPIGQRVSAGVAMLIVVGLIAWLLVPDRHRSSPNVSASSGSAGQSTASTASGGPAPGGVPGGGTSATPGAGGTTG